MTSRTINPCTTCRSRHPIPPVPECQACGRMLVHPDSVAHHLCVACRTQHDDQTAR
jgi:hypothetical protein